MSLSRSELSELKILIKVLKDTIESTKDKTPLVKNSFYAIRPPEVSVEFYISRIVKHMQLKVEDFIYLLIYLDQYSNATNDFLNAYNIHRLIITSALVVSKFWHDTFYNNAHAARVGGVSLTELNKLEVDFLFYINFKMYIPSEVIEKYKEEVKKYGEQYNQPSSTLQEEKLFIKNGLAL